MGSARFVETTRKQPPGQAGGKPRVPVLVIAHHPTLARVGESLALHDRVELSRLAPAFGGALDDREPAPLDDPFVSRTPIALRRDGDGVVIENPSGVELAIGGVELPGPLSATATSPPSQPASPPMARDTPAPTPVPAAGESRDLGAARTPQVAGPIDVRGTRRITGAELARGIDVVLGNRVVLWLTLDHAGASDELGLVGSSAAIATLRSEIRAAATSAGPILVEGETGVGKELVARALHGCGPRAEQSLVAVNVAAIPAAVAAAELFGHERGAFTGAGERRAGYFERADRGVLFLDEIGDLPESVQPILLRALESGEIQPIGGTPKRVDVLVVAATDADLARAAQTGRYRGPLYYRLAGTTLRVPPLRERRVDIGPLLARFLLEQLDGVLADQATSATPWLPARIAAELVRAGWPGNVRQLRAVAARLAGIARAGRRATLEELGANLGLDDLDAELVEAIDSSRGITAAAGGPGDASRAGGGSDGPDAAPHAPPIVSPAPEAASAARVVAHGRRSTGAPIDEPALVATLRRHRFQLAPAAEELGVSRTHLDALIARSGSLRKAKDLSREEIDAASAELDHDLDAMAAKLEVSPRGLRLRMRQLA